MKLCPACKQQFDGGEQFCPFDGARLTTASALRLSTVDDDPFIGATIADRYQITRCIGSGGMGVVYEATHTTLGRKFAVKILRPQVSTDADVVQRFQIEAKSASRIGHENIIEVTDFGLTLGGAPFMVMEHLDGEDLADVIARERVLPVTRVVPIILQCCRALGAAHAKGIVHRDMKPENVFLVHRDGLPDFVKIVDFGIAKISDLDTTLGVGRRLTKTGMIFGTPEYMSTEQAFGRPTDHRSDIYALGIMMFEMFAGRVPFKGESFMAILSQHMLDPAPTVHDVNPNAALPPGFEDIIARTLEKDPNARYQSMRELHEAIVGACEAAGIAPLAMAHNHESSWVGPLPTGPKPASTVATAPALANPSLGGSGDAPAHPVSPSRVVQPLPTPQHLEPHDGYGVRAPRAPTSRGLWVGLVIVLALAGGGVALGSTMGLFDGGDDGDGEPSPLAIQPTVVNTTPEPREGDDAGAQVAPGVNDGDGEPEEHDFVEGTTEVTHDTESRPHNHVSSMESTTSMTSTQTDPTTSETTGDMALPTTTMDTPAMARDPNAPSLEDLRQLPGTEPTSLNGLQPYE